MSLTITQVRPARKKDWFVIEFEGDKNLTVSSAGLAKFRLSVGKQLTAEQVGEISHYTDFTRIYDRAVSFISYRPRSEKEVYDRISRKADISSELIDELMARLRVEKLVNDEEFTRWWCEQRGRFRPRSRRRLSVELWQKGVERKLVEKMVGELVNEEELVEKILIKKYPQIPTDQHNQQKMMQSLVRQGFSWDVVKKVVSQKLAHD